MKITNVSTHLIHPERGKNWLFVKIETDEGSHGWGEAYAQADRDKSVEIHVQQLARYSEGRSPFDIKHFTHWPITTSAGSVVQWISIAR